MSSFILISLDDCKLVFFLCVENLLRKIIMNNFFVKYNSGILKTDYEFKFFIDFVIRNGVWMNKNLLLKMTDNIRVNVILYFCSNMKRK